MAAKAQETKTDPVREAAADRFAARSHAAWRRILLKTNPEQKGKARMRMRGGMMVDVNQPWSKLHPKAKADNKLAAYDAYDAVRKFPRDREAAADYVHQCWIKRNRKDPSQPKALFKPYARLPEVEKDKDRAHVDTMKEIVAALRKKAPRTLPKTAKRRAAKKKAGVRTVQVDAAAWRRLEAAARDLSEHSGQPVTPEALMSAGIEAMAVVCKSLAGGRRK